LFFPCRFSCGVLDEFVGQFLALWRLVFHSVRVVACGVLHYTPIKMLEEVMVSRENMANKKERTPSTTKVEGESRGLTGMNDCL
jgi:hypothetical protein